MGKISLWITNVRYVLYVRYVRNRRDRIPEKLWIGSSNSIGDGSPGAVAFHLRYGGENTPDMAIAVPEGIRDLPGAQKRRLLEE